jgi:hypothetical protein
MRTSHIHKVAEPSSRKSSARTKRKTANTKLCAEKKAPAMRDSLRMKPERSSGNRTRTEKPWPGAGTRVRSQTRWQKQISRTALERAPCAEHRTGDGGNWIRDRTERQQKSRPNGDRRAGVLRGPASTVAWTPTESGAGVNRTKSGSGTRADRQLDSTSRRIEQKNRPRP